MIELINTGHLTGGNMALTKSEWNKRKKESAARKQKYISDYQSMNYTNVTTKFRKDTDGDILEHLEKEENKGEAVKKALRAYYHI